MPLRSRPELARNSTTRSGVTTSAGPADSVVRAVLVALVVGVNAVLVWTTLSGLAGDRPEPVFAPPPAEKVERTPYLTVHP